MRRRVAVVGAGPCGLAAVKCCKDEGFDVVCFERTDHIGGLWHYTPDVVEDQGCVMKSTELNTSKEMMAFSDFPCPPHFANYMKQSRVLEYFHLYAHHFHLHHALCLSTEVLRVARAPDFDTTGNWDLQLKDLTTGVVRWETFSAVMVCTGHHARPHHPQYPGMDRFTGHITHSHDYKDHVGYEDKRVVVVGIGNSGGDVAAELGRISKQVYLSTRRGVWLLNKVADGGMPVDMMLNRRFIWWLRSKLPISWINSQGEKRVNRRFDHAVYGLKPKHRIMSQHPTVNDDLPNRIICGSVIVKPDIKTFTRTGVEFEDGTVEDDIDDVVFATGYVFGFPFIDTEVLRVKDNYADLYKFILPPNLEHPTLAIIGFIQPIGSIMPTAEMQCRWVTKLWKGEVKLPLREEMWNEINRKKEGIARRYIQSRRHTLQADSVPFMDELAKDIGCKPSLSMFLKDPILAWMCFFGPCTPYQYRLTGPHPWPGAREAILTTWDRVVAPLATRKVVANERSPETTSLLVSGLVLLVLCFIISSTLF